MPKEIETGESWLSPRAKHWLDHALRLLPLLSLCVVLVFWVDARYVHKQNSDIRYTHLQIQVLESQISAYHKLVNPTAVETSEYNRLEERLAKHTEEWNDLLGITAQ